MELELKKPSKQFWVTINVVLVVMIINFAVILYNFNGVIKTRENTVHTFRYPKGTNHVEVIIRNNQKTVRIVKNEKK